MNLDPQTMQMAMEQMRKLSPEQMQAMMRNMPANLSMSPDMMNAAMAQMKNMKPEELNEAMAAMNAPGAADRMAEGARTMAARQQYVITASTTLKNEGNTLHNAGRYKEAQEKYEHAKRNIEGYTQKEAADLRRACTLNLSSCYLNLQQYAQCVDACGEVLASEPDNLKALYRRGQARSGLQHWPAAVADLERAVKLAAGDPVQLGLIREKLQEAKDAVSALRAAGGGKYEEAVAAAAAADAASGRGAGGASSSGRPPAAAELPSPELVEQAQRMMQAMTDDQLTTFARQFGVDATPEQLRSGSHTIPGMSPELIEKAAKLKSHIPAEVSMAAARGDPDAVKKAAELLASNPDAIKGVSEMMSSLSPEQLAAMSKASGMPAGMQLTPEMARAAAESIKGMGPEELKAMAEMAAKQGPAMRAGMTAQPAGGASSSGASTAVAPAPLAPLAGMPVDTRMAADMIENMTPEQLEALTKMAPGAGGMKMTPEMAKMAAGMMRSMSPEDIKRMQEMAASMGMGPGGAGAGAATGLGAMPAMNPDMAKAAADMMANMKPEDLAAMQAAVAGGAMGGGAPAGGMGMGMGGAPGGAMSGTADAMAAMRDPAMMKTALNMMRSMPPEAVVDMMMSSGMCKNREQATKMSEQMRSMSDKQMEMMMKAASAMQGAGDALRRVRDWAAKNVLLLTALVVLLLALLLRWLGYM